MSKFEIKSDDGDNPMLSYDENVNLTRRSVNGFEKAVKRIKDVKIIKED